MTKQTSTDQHAKFGFINELKVDSNVAERLSRLLDYTLKGSNAVLTTPLAKVKSPELLLSEFDKIYKDNVFKLNDVLQNLENSNRDKFGPRSIAVPYKDRVKSLLSSFEEKNYDSYFDLRSTDDLHRLRPISIESSLKLLKNNTNSGLPYFTQKGKVKEDMSENFINLLKRKDPCILFTRTQENLKTRNVWGYPMADTLNEMRYYYPLLNLQKKLNYRSAIISPDKVGTHITEIINKSVNEKLEICSIDFTAFDTSVSSKLQVRAFDYIKSLFQTSYHDEIDYISNRFRSIGIVTPYGVVEGIHGVPSGSTFTNEVDSIVQSSIAISSNILFENHFEVQGDDGVYLLPQGGSSKLIKTFESCGLNVSDKIIEMIANNHCTYLQCLYHIDYIKDGFIGGIYPVYRALNRLIYQERWSDFEEVGIEGKDYYSIRAICILENCKYHPLFENLVEFVVNNDKYSLDFSDQGLSNYVQMVEEAKGLGGISNQYGDNVSGIRNFETYKLIRKLS